MKQYLFKVLVAMTQGLNALLGGDPDQPFSSRSYEAKLSGKFWGAPAVFVIDTIFYPFDGPRHCAQAFANDTERTYSSG